MSAFLTGTVGSRRANATIVGNPQPRRAITARQRRRRAPYRRRHHGTDPSTSALNRYLQSWRRATVRHGRRGLPQNPPQSDGTIGALTYWSAHAITSAISEIAGPAGQGVGISVARMERSEIRERCSAFTSFHAGYKLQVWSQRVATV